MGPLRPLLILLVAVTGIRLLGALAKRLPFISTVARASPSGTLPRMVRCAYCGEYAPEDEGFKTGPGTFYCCREHAEAGRTRASSP